MAGERVRWHFQESSFFQRERAFKGEREYFQERRIQESPGYLTSAFRHHPNGCLDQLDPMLALGAALFLHPINKSTCHV